jgi:predicted nucleic acid-binding protein
VVVFDTEALLIYYLGEAGSSIVEELLEQVKTRSLEGYVNVVNLTEFYYILYRCDPRVAEEKVRNLRAFGLEIVPLTDNALWREAGRLKGEYALSLADAFAAATAVQKGDRLVVGRDEEFDQLAIPLIKVR